MYVAEVVVHFYIHGLNIGWKLEKVEVKRGCFFSASIMDGYCRANKSSKMLCRIVLSWEVDSKKRKVHQNEHNSVDVMKDWVGMMSNTGILVFDHFARSYKS